MKALQSICSFLAWALGVYSTIVLIRIIISWVLVLTRRNSWGTYNPQEQETPSALVQVDRILGKICDPFLNMFRGVKSLRRSNLDFTPVLALVLLNLVRSILSLFSQTTDLTVWTILAIIVNGLWESFLSFLLILLIIILVVRFFIGRSTGAQANDWINMIDPILDGPVGFVYKLFYRKKNVDDQKLVITSIIFYAVLYVALRWGVGKLVDLLVSL